MADYPPKLQEYLDDFDFVSSRDERVDFLIDIADEFEPVPPSVASKPYDEAHRVIGCESEAFVWALDRESAWRSPRKTAAGSTRRLRAIRPG